uniref:Uncharacterized protein n=1 Tax=Arundo donax TaxID=35708 RepID=A0A0A9BH34_ARUDO
MIEICSRLIFCFQLDIKNHNERIVSIHAIDLLEPNSVNYNPHLVDAWFFFPLQE